MYIRYMFSLFNGSGYILNTIIVYGVGSRWVVGYGYYIFLLGGYILLAYTVRLHHVRTTCTT